MEDVEQALNTRFFSPKREAVIAAIQDVQKQCRELRVSQRQGRTRRREPAVQVP